MRVIAVTSQKSASGETAQGSIALQVPTPIRVNGAVKRARSSGSAAFAVAQLGSVTPPIIHHRQSFAPPMIVGCTVVECDPASRSAGEVPALSAYASQRVEKLPYHCTNLSSGALTTSKHSQTVLARSAFGRHIIAFSSVPGHQGKPVQAQGRPS